METIKFWRRVLKWINEQIKAEQEEKQPVKKEG